MDIVPAAARIPRSVAAILLVCAVVTTILLADIGATAVRIERRTRGVASITTAAANKTRAVRGLSKTADTSEAIDVSTRPMDEQLKEIQRLSESIDDTMASIIRRASTIDSSVASVGRTSGSAAGSAQSIANRLKPITRLVDALLGRSGRAK